MRARLTKRSHAHARSSRRRPDNGAEITATSPRAEICRPHQWRRGREERSRLLRRLRREHADDTDGAVHTVADETVAFVMITGIVFHRIYACAIRGTNDANHLSMSLRSYALFCGSPISRPYWARGSPVIEHCERKRKIM